MAKDVNVPRAKCELKFISADAGNETGDKDDSSEFRNIKQVSDFVDLEKVSVLNIFQ